MASVYDVILFGWRDEVTDRDQVVDHLAKILKLEPGVVAQVRQGGTAVVLRSALPKEIADRYRAALTKSGIICNLRPSQARTPELVLVPMVEDEDARSELDFECPSCGFRQTFETLGEVPLLCPACGVSPEKFNRLREEIAERERIKRRLLKQQEIDQRQQEEEAQQRRREAERQALEDEIRREMNLSPLLSTRGKRMGIGAVLWLTGVMAGVGAVVLYQVLTASPPESVAVKPDVAPTAAGAGGSGEVVPADRAVGLPVSSQPLSAARQAKVQAAALEAMTQKAMVIATQSQRTGAPPPEIGVELSKGMPSMGADLAAVAEGVAAFDDATGADAVEEADSIAESSVNYPAGNAGSSDAPADSGGTGTEAVTVAAGDSVLSRGGTPSGITDSTTPATNTSAAGLGAANSTGTPSARVRATLAKHEAVPSSTAPIRSAHTDSGNAAYVTDWHAVLLGDGADPTWNRFLTLELDKALAAGQPDRARQLAEALPEGQTVRWRALLSVADDLHRRGQVRARDAVLKALEVELASVRDLPVRVDALGWMAGMLNAMGLKDRAALLTQSMSRQAAEVSVRDGKVAALGYAAAHLALLGQSSAADSAWSSANQLLANESGPLVRLMGYIRLAESYALAGDKDTARGLLAPVRAALQSVPDGDGRTAIVSALARALSDLGDADAAQSAADLLASPIQQDTLVFELIQEQLSLGRPDVAATMANGLSTRVYAARARAGLAWGYAVDQRDELQARAAMGQLTALLSSLDQPVARAMVKADLARYQGMLGNADAAVRWSIESVQAANVVTDVRLQERLWAYVALAQARANLLPDARRSADRLDDAGASRMLNAAVARVAKVYALVRP